MKKSRIKHESVVIITRRQQLVDEISVLALATAMCVEAGVEIPGWVWEEVKEIKKKIGEM